MSYNAAQITSDRPLEIQAANGSFEIKGEEIEGAFVDLRSEEGMPADKRENPDRYLEMTEGEKTVLRLIPDWERGEDRVVRVHLPSGEQWNVSIRTSNGSIRVENLSGYFDASSSNGRIRLENVSGSFHGTCANGSVEGKNVVGKTDITTSNGRITLRESRLSEGSLQSGNGKINVQLKPEGSGSLSVLSGNGKVRLAVPEDSDFRIQVQTKGKLHNHLENYSVQTEGNTTILERGSGEYSVLIQNYKWGVTLVKYDDFDTKTDEDQTTFWGEDMGDFFQNLFSGVNPQDFERKVHRTFDQELPKIMSKMAHFGNRFGRMGEEISRKFHEKSRDREDEISLILDMLKEGKISAEEAEKLIRAIREK